MRLLIDGYNLLHATDLFGAGDLAGTLRGSREALLGFLAARLTERERRWTVIVFDAKDAPAGLPDRYSEEGIDVRFARGFPDADAMIEEILEGATGARELTVVSGDRRVQRAARSRGAKPVDSSGWFGELCRREPDASRRVSNKEPIGSSEEWVKAFSDPEPMRPHCLRPRGPRRQLLPRNRPPPRSRQRRRTRRSAEERCGRASHQPAIRSKRNPSARGFLTPSPRGMGRTFSIGFPKRKTRKMVFAARGTTETTVTIDPCAVIGSVDCRDPRDSTHKTFETFHALFLGVTSGWLAALRGERLFLERVLCAPA